MPWCAIIVLWGSLVSLLAAPCAAKLVTFDNAKPRLTSSGANIKAHDGTTQRFGERVLSAPRPEGFGLTAYLVPVLAFVAGGVLVTAFLRRQTREAAAAPRPVAAPAGTGDPELERLVDEELSR